MAVTRDAGSARMCARMRRGADEWHNCAGRLAPSTNRPHGHAYARDCPLTIRRTTPAEGWSPRPVNGPHAAPCAVHARTRSPRSPPRDVETRSATPLRQRHAAMPMRPRMAEPVRAGRHAGSPALALQPRRAGGLWGRSGTQRHLLPSLPVLAVPKRPRAASQGRGRAQPAPRAARPPPYRAGRLSLRGPEWITVRASRWSPTAHRPSR